MDKEKRISTFQILVFVILFIYILNLAEGILIVIRTGQWSGLIGKFISFLIIGFIAYRSWLSIRKRRESYRQRMEAQQEMGLRDAALFSLTWSREIYQSIPEDRKHLVQNAFILIAIALGIAYLQFGSLLTILLVAVLVLAGVNLLVWVVASEREDKDRIMIELETARQMQLALMPESDPQVHGFDISGCCIPARDVGGDLFDFVWFPEEKRKLCITVVDVSGKGMDAAFTAVYTSGAFISEIQHEKEVKTIADNLNSAIYSRQDRNRFVCALMVSLDVSNRKINYVNAGQMRPLLLRKGNLTVLKNQGARFPLGVVESPQYKSASTQLRSGDRLLLYTDGVNEAMNSKNEMFGNERLSDLLLSLGQESLTSNDIVLSIKDSILDFSKPAQQHDDLTIVCIGVQ